VEQIMSDPRDEKPKIYVDSDWKEEAQREKEKADQQASESAGQEQLPAPSFMEILQMIIVQASIGLGGYQDPQTGQNIPPNLDIAKHYIDLLELLQNKTQGNLDENEKKAMDQILNELRMAFVQAAQGGQQGGQGPAGGPQQNPGQ
jgi:hypothetical protein